MKKTFWASILLILCGSSASAQNVGIGTSSPGYKLDVVGRTRLQAGTVNDPFTSAGTWLTDYRTNTDLVFVGMADSVNYGFWSQRQGVAWQFYFDARYGNVGIGRKPSAGSGRLALDHPSGASLNVYASGSYRGGFQATDSSLEIFSSYGSSTTIPATPGKDIVFWPPPAPCLNPPCFVAATPGRIGMYTNNPAARLHITATTGTSGVLIGSTASVPAAGYMLSVDGKVICEELKVQLNSAWPDYVFEPDYPLIPLDQLEQQVIRQKHLPGIPSAAAVTKENGFAVGDMQKMMLEKIEELYRYVFQLNAENKALRAAIAQKQ